MKMSEMSENDFIKHIKNEIQSSFHHKASMIGIGDDCSVQDLPGDFYQICSTDLMVEDTHFLRSHIKPNVLGRKLVEVNVSDIAAMGGAPRSAFLSLALPRNLEVTYSKELVNAIIKRLDDYRIDLLGGDTTSSSEKIILSLLIQGEVAKNKMKLRSQAKFGDVVCLSGFVGESAIGLKLLLDPALREKFSIEHCEHFISKHLSPHAHLQEGLWLAEKESVHAMMDVSDGVFQDLERMCLASKVGAKIFLEQYPMSNKTKDFLATQNETQKNHLLNGGEDYCLLLAVDPDDFQQLSLAFSQQFSRPLFAIGQITQSSGVSIYNDGRVVDTTNVGFQHFGGR